MIRTRASLTWEVQAQQTPNFDSLFDQVGSLRTSPEVLEMREFIRRWRFYDHFRSDADAPVRQPQLGTRTPVLHHDGRDLAAALQTIIEIGDPEAFQPCRKIPNAIALCWRKPWARPGLSASGCWMSRCGIGRINQGITPATSHPRRFQTWCHRSALCARMGHTA
jgi:hypothetical protein